MARVFTTENFDAEVLQSKVPVLVDFYADWCGPCKMMAPIVEDFAKAYGESVTVGKINVDDAQDLAAKYSVMTIPTILLIKNGEVKEKYVGVTSQSAIAEAITKLL